MSRDTIGGVFRWWELRGGRETSTRLSHDTSCSTRVFFFACRSARCDLAVRLSAFASRFPLFISLPMAATPSDLWVCTECGRVCKSRGGLAQHSSIHKRHLRVGEPRNNFQRVYHPTFNGMLNFFPDSPILTSLKENHVVETESFSHPEHHQLPHPQNPMTIGPPLHHALGLNLQKSSTPRRHSQTTLSTDSSASGVPH